MNAPDAASEPGPHRVLDQSVALLGWDLIQNALAGYAHSSLTESTCRTLLPQSDFELSQQALETTAEMVSLLDSDAPFPIAPFDDIGPVIAKAAENRILEPKSCLQILKLLRLSRNLKRALEKTSEAPRLADLGGKLDPLPSLLKELENTIDEDGEIQENATPELKEAVREAAAAKHKLESKLDKLRDSLRDSLQDSYITEREGRLVLPVNADFKSRIDGIVHDSSGSGQTLFVEPTSVIPLNNQLKICRLRIEQEKIRILQSLAALTLENQDALLANLETMAALDGIHCKARLAKTMQARLCPISLDGEVNLIQARNPELILNKQDVVPNDIRWDASVRVLIISGPNTGGKTVTLKTVGLLSLMARAGLFLPVAEGSRMRFFDTVFADIGDDQNIRLNLSTFSAHLEKIVHITKHARPGTLILLDELGIATEPAEGAALAEAILLDLKRKDVVTLVSTHYHSLKMLAQTQEGFLNACTEFDAHSLSPTYRLIFGAPGHSNALETAQRLGLDPGIIEAARGIHAATDTRAESFLKDLTEQRLKLEQETDRVRTQRKELDALTKEQKSLTETLREEEKEFKKNRSKRMQAHIREAKAQIRRMIQGIKGTKDIAKVRKAEKKITALGRVPLSAQVQDHAGWEVPADKLAVGDKVLVTSYGAFGVLLEPPGQKSRVHIQMGNLKTVVDLKELRGHRNRSRPAKPKAAPVEIKVEKTRQAKLKTTCDLRGMDSETALTEMERFLSQAVVNQVRTVTLIHGHGMGTLKHLVRDYLGSTGLCKQFEPGKLGEGGDGITIVEL